MTPASVTLDGLVDVIGDRSAGSSRLLIGLAGSPGVGKSTVAQTLAERLGDRSVVLGMDGFHLASRTLADLGLSNVKGAPQTFDAEGIVALLGRIRRQPEGTVFHAPAYDRGLGEPIANAVPVTADHSVVIVEGNYLLLDGPWAGVKETLDITVYLRLEPTIRVERLIARHIAFGKSPDHAREWVHRSDEANARLVEAAAGKADYYVEVP
jgi:pantothenate kinase